MPARVALALALPSPNGGAAPPTGDAGVSIATAPPGAVAGSVSAGLEHSCGVRPAGRLACWGENNLGQASPPAGSFTAPSVGLYHAAPCAPTGRGARPGRSCTARGFRARVRIRDRSRLRYARLFLDGRRRLNTTRKSFRVQIRASRLRSGRHRITVTVQDSPGNRGLRSVRFTRCARPRTLGTG